MIDPILLEKILWATVKILAIFFIGFIFGLAYATRKYQPRRFELRKLHKQNQMMKRLTPKLKWGEDVKLKRPKRLAPLRKEGCPPFETATQGDPEDA